MGCMPTTANVFRLPHLLSVREHKSGPKSCQESTDERGKESKCPLTASEIPKIARAAPGCGLSVATGRMRSIPSRPSSR